MSFPQPQTKEFTARLDGLAEQCRAELNEAMQSLQEITLLINQSSSEVERLTQRELALSNRVREMEANLESYARRDIRDMFRAAHEVELRLMMMRSQVEQLEEREKSIRAYQEKLRLLLDLAETNLQVEQEKAEASDKRTRLLRRGQSGGPVIPFADIIQAQEDERLRVAHLMVDGPVQHLANILLRAEICERVFERTPEETPGELAALRTVASDALRDTRRLMLELRPLVLREIGAVPTLRRYVTELVRLRRFDVNIVGPESDDKLPEILRVAFYRLMQQMISAVASDIDVARIDIDVRYEDAQVVGRVEARGQDLDRSQEIARFLADETVRRRIDQIAADLQTEVIGSETARLTLVIPLG